MAQVCIQLPIFNDVAVCQSAIDFSCEMNWPKNRLVIQVHAKNFELDFPFQQHFDFKTVARRTWKGEAPIICRVKLS